MSVTTAEVGGAQEKSADRVVDYLLDDDEVAERLDISRSSVKRLRRAGKIKSLKIGNLTKTLESEVCRVIAEAPAA